MVLDEEVPLQNARSGGGAAGKMPAELLSTQWQLVKGHNFNFQRTNSLTFSSAESGEQERVFCSRFFLSAAGARRDPPCQAGHGVLLIGLHHFGSEVFICAATLNPVLNFNK